MLNIVEFPDLCFQHIAICFSPCTTRTERVQNQPEKQIAVNDEMEEIPSNLFDSHRSTLALFRQDEIR
jgi:hypothetical protein